jgi:hypothetical protein
MSGTKRVTDSQRQRVYDWESRHVAPLDTGHVAFDNIQAVVNHVWAAERLQYPPQVETLTDRATTKAADATRLEVRFKAGGTKTWIILHELAHSMTSTCEGIGESMGHNRVFVGVYMRLLEKYLGVNLLVLMATAKSMKVDFDIMASPVFLD